MSFTDAQVQITYFPIGTLLLVHMHSRKIIDAWTLYDLEELARESGKSIDEVLRLLTRK